MRPAIVENEKKKIQIVRDVVAVLILDHQIPAAKSKYFCNKSFSLNFRYA